jgi:hypothetical protein
MASLDDLMEFEGRIWTRRELFEEAFRLLDRVDYLLENSRKRCEAREAFDRAMEAI